VVLSHPAQNVVQHHYGFIDVRSLVQHDAFRTLPHRGVADLGARRLGTNLVILVPQAPPKVTEGLVPVRAARPNGGSVGEPHAATLLTSILDIQVRQGVSQPNADN
jgi:hypothetical protein